MTPRTASLGSWLEHLGEGALHARDGLVEARGRKLAPRSVPVTSTAQGRGNRLDVHASAGAKRDPEEPWPSTLPYETRDLDASDFATVVHGAILVGGRRTAALEDRCVQHHPC